MATVAVLVTQVAGALSLSQVREMPPPVAGNAILGDLPHGQIESFRSPTGGMLPSDVIEGQFVEKPNLLDSVCVRKVWTVLFRASPGSDIGTAKPETKRDNQEIALPIDHSCPSGQYAYLNPGINLEKGGAILNRVKAISLSRSHTHFKCSDETSSSLCADDEATRANLRAMKPWLITGGGKKVSFGIPGGVVTEVDFESLDNSTIRINRFNPAPL